MTELTASAGTCSRIADRTLAELAGSISAKKTGSVTALRQLNGVGRPPSASQTTPVAMGFFKSGVRISNFLSSPGSTPEKSVSDAAVAGPTVKSKGKGGGSRLDQRAQPRIATPPRMSPDEATSRPRESDSPKPREMRQSPFTAPCAGFCPPAGQRPQAMRSRRRQRPPPAGRACPAQTDRRAFAARGASAPRVFPPPRAIVCPRH